MAPRRSWAPTSSCSSRQQILLGALELRCLLVIAAALSLQEGFSPSFCAR